MAFFDTTPLGRILNRFSKDTYTIDETLMPSIYMYLQCMTAVLGTSFPTPPTHPPTYPFIHSRHFSPTHPPPHPPTHPFNHQQAPSSSSRL